MKKSFFGIILFICLLVISSSSMAKNPWFWLNTELDWNDIQDTSTSGELLVAVGDKGLLLTSTDGINWSHLYSGTQNNLHKVIYTGSSYIVVGAGVIVYSSDGIIWQAIETREDNLVNVAWSGSLLVATGHNHVLTSADGLIWVTHEPFKSELDQLSGSGFEAIVWHRDAFYALNGTSIYSSVNGRDWNKLNLSGLTSSRQGISFGRKIYAFKDKLLLQDNRDGLFISSDAIQWQKIEIETRLTQIVDTGGQLVAFSPKGQLFSSEDGLSWNIVTHIHDQILAFFSTTSGKVIHTPDQILVSGDLLAWKSQTRTNSDLPSTKRELNFTGNSFSGMTSPLVAQQQRGIPDDNAFDWEDILDSTRNGNIIHAAGRNGLLVTTNDGIHWNKLTSGTASDILHILYANNYYVASTSNSLLYSKDGIYWKPALFPTINFDPIAIVRAGTNLIALGKDKILRTRNGSLWEIRNWVRNDVTGEFSWKWHEFLNTTDNLDTEISVWAKDEAQETFSWHWKSINRDLSPLHTKALLWTKFADTDEFSWQWQTVKQDDITHLTLKPDSCPINVTGATDNDYLLSHCSDLDNILWHKNALYVFIRSDNQSKAVISSTDGISWKKLETADFPADVDPAQSKFYSVANNNLVLYEQHSGLFVSKNTTDWEKLEFDHTLQDILNADNKLIALTPDRKIISTVNGLTWDVKKQIQEPILSLLSASTYNAIQTPSQTLISDATLTNWDTYIKDPSGALPRFSQMFVADDQLFIYGQETLGTRSADSDWQYQPLPSPNGLHSMHKIDSQYLMFTRPIGLKTDYSSQPNYTRLYTSSDKLNWTHTLDLIDVDMDRLKISDGLSFIQGENLLYVNIGNTWRVLDVSEFSNFQINDVKLVKEKWNYDDAESTNSELCYMQKTATEDTNTELLIEKFFIVGDKGLIAYNQDGVWTKVDTQSEAEFYSLAALKEPGIETPDLFRYTYVATGDEATIRSHSLSQALTLTKNGKEGYCIDTENGDNWASANLPGEIFDKDGNIVDTSAGKLEKLIIHREENATNVEGQPLAKDVFITFLDVNEDKYPLRSENGMEWQQYSETISYPQSISSATIQLTSEPDLETKTLLPDFGSGVTGNFPLARKLVQTPSDPETSGTLVSIGAIDATGRLLMRDTSGEESESFSIEKRLDINPGKLVTLTGLIDSYPNPIKEMSWEQVSGTPVHINNTATTREESGYSIVKDTKSLSIYTPYSEGELQFLFSVTKTTGVTYNEVVTINVQAEEQTSTAGKNKSGFFSFFGALNPIEIAAFIVALTIGRFRTTRL